MSCDQEFFQISLRDRKRRFRQSLEGREDKREETFRNERDAKGENYSEAEREFRYEREEIPVSAKSQVTLFDLQLLGKHGVLFPRSPKSLPGY